VPGHLAAKVEHYLKALPKEMRRIVMPQTATARALVPQLASRDRLTGRRETLPQALAALLGERFQLRLDPAVWAERPLPDHLQVRVRVRDETGNEVVASRDLTAVQAAVAARQHEASRTVAKDAPRLWQQARQRWETDALSEWSIGELPEVVEVGEQAGVP